MDKLFTRGGMLIRRLLSFTLDRLAEIRAIFADDEQRLALEDAELATMEAELLDLFDAIRAGEVEDVNRNDLDRLTEIAETIDSIRSEAGVRYETAAAADAEEARLEAEAEALASRLRGEDDGDDPEGGDPDPEGDPEGADPEAEPADPAAPDPEPAPAPAPTADAEPEPVLAAAAPALPPVGALGAVPTARRHRPAPVRTRPAIEAIGLRRNVDFGELARIFIERREDFVSYSGGGEEKIRLGRMRVEFPEDRRLNGIGADAEAFERIVEPVVASAMLPSSWTDEALVASGGFCAPLEVDYEIAQISGAQRPVRDSLPRFGADRGGLRHIRPGDLADVDVSGAGAAVGLWTNSTDEAPGENVKTCQTVPCPEVVDVELQAIYRCLQFGNFQSRAFPELVRKWIADVGAAWARVAEQELLDGIGANSTAITTTQVLGAVADLLAYINQAGASYRSRHRMPRDARLRLYLPAWVIDLFQADLARRHAGDGIGVFAVAEAEIRSWFAARNVNVTFYIDTETGAGQVFGAQGATDLRNFPSTAVWYLFHEGAFVFLDGGMLDLGLVRDSSLNETNDYRIFAESFEEIAFKGVESYKVTSTLCATGEGALDADPSAICNAS